LPVVILICSAFFSASETSMMALNRLRLNHLVRKGNKSAKLTAKLLSHTDQLLGSILFGNTLLNAAAASLTGIIILRMFGANDLVAARHAGDFFIIVTWRDHAQGDCRHIRTHALSVL
jgi:Mg2+/Co2+ transporter CorB